MHVTVPSFLIVWNRAALQAAHICVFVADMADRASLEVRWGGGQWA